MAIERVPSVTSVTTDIHDHTVTVGFDDEKASIDDIVKALNESGHSVPRYAPES